MSSCTKSVCGDCIEAMKIIGACLMVAFVTGLTTSFATAEGISVETWRGHTVVRLSDEISPGLADELAGKIDQAEIWTDGTRVLLLDSPEAVLTRHFAYRQFWTGFHSTRSSRMVPAALPRVVRSYSLQVNIGRWKHLEKLDNIAVCGATSRINNAMMKSPNMQ